MGEDVLKRTVFKSIFSLACMFALVSSVQAVTIKTNSGLVIQSIQSKINGRSGHSIHEGDVVVSDGEFELHAERVVEIRKDGAVQEIVAYGTATAPVKFIARDPHTRGFREGEAKVLVYQRNKGTVSLEDYQLTYEKGNLLRGRKLTYLVDELF